MQIKLKRAYEDATSSDGYRVLVDRLWPRGLSKEKAKIDIWDKQIAPSNDLRSAFHHRTMSWEDFSKHYRQELKDNPLTPEFIASLKDKPVVTLLFASKDEEHNQAVLLKELLDKAS